jgi:hypothetical protein
MDLFLFVGLPVIAVVISIGHIFIVVALHRIHKEIHGDVKLLLDNANKITDAVVAIRTSVEVR